MIDRARIQEAALHSQRRLRVALESSQVSFGIAVPAAEGGFVWDYLNPIGAATLGHHGSAAHPSLPWAGPRILQACGEHQADEAAWSVELQGADASGTSRWLQISATPFDGNVAVWFLDIASANARNSSCATTIGKRTNSSPCWPTSCAIRWRPSAMRRR